MSQSSRQRLSNEFQIKIHKLFPHEERLLLIMLEDFEKILREEFKKKLMNDLMTELMKDMNP